MSLAVIQDDAAGGGEIETPFFFLFFFFFFYKDFTEPSHVSDSFPEGDGGEGGVILAEKKKRIVCPYLSCFQTYSTLAAESRGD